MIHRTVTTAASLALFFLASGLVPGATAVQLFNGTSGGLTTANDVGRMRISVEAGDAGILEIGDVLRGVFSIDSFEYVGDPTQPTGGANDFVVGDFEQQVVSKIPLFGSTYLFGFSAVGGGDGVVAGFYSLPGATAFDVASDSAAGLETLFVGGTHLFNLSLIAANGDSLTVIGDENLTVLSPALASLHSIDLTITDLDAAINFSSDDMLGNGKHFENISGNVGDYPLSSDVDFFFTLIPVPEPGSLALLSLGASALLRLRRRHRSAR